MSSRKKETHSFGKKKIHESRKSYHKKVVIRGRSRSSSECYSVLQSQNVVLALPLVAQDPDLLKEERLGVPG